MQAERKQNTSCERKQCVTVEVVRKILPTAMDALNQSGQILFIHERHLSGNNGNEEPNRDLSTSAMPNV
jgi:hypothetical protein